MKWAGARPAETPFRLEIVGEDGTLSLEGGAPRGFQSGRLQLMLNGKRQHVNEGEIAAMPDAAANVAGIYAALRDDINNGNSKAPTFQHAVRVSRLIDDVVSSSMMGIRKLAKDWPL